MLRAGVCWLKKGGNYTGGIQSRGEGSSGYYPAGSAVKQNLSGNHFKSGTLKAQGRPVLELHAESQATCSQNFLDFVERLATQVRSLEQLVFGTLDEVADVVNVLCLEAVCRTYGEFQIVDRTQQNRVDLRLRTGRCFVCFVRTFQCREHRQLIHQDASGL